MASKGGQHGYVAAMTRITASAGSAPVPSDPRVIAPSHTLTWLLHTTNRMVGCRSMAALLDMAYDAIREGLGYDRVGLQLIDASRQVMQCHIGTNADGIRHFRDDRETSLKEDNYYTRLLADPRMQVSGPGYIFLGEAETAAILPYRKYLDGQPRQNILVALRTMERVIGYISVDNLVTGRPIVEADALPLVAFANGFAASLENVTLLESRARKIDDLDADLRHQVEHLAWLKNAAGLLAALHDLDSVLDTIYSSVREGLKYDRLGLVLIGPRDGRLVAFNARGADDQGWQTPGYTELTFLDDPDLPIHSPDLYHLLQGHAFYYCPDRWAITAPEHRSVLDGRMGEQLVVALRHDGDLVGFISVDNLISRRPITAEDATPLIAFSSQAALAISRARLWADHEAQSRYLAHRVTELEWLRETSRRINTAATLDAVLDVISEGVRDGMSYERVGVWLFNHVGTLLEPRRAIDSRGYHLFNAPTIAVGLDGTLLPTIPGLDRLARGEVACWLSDPMGYPSGAPALLPGAPTSCLLVALRSNDAFSGLIVVDNQSSMQPLLIEQAGPLLALASQVSTVVSNMRLREQEWAERARLALLLESAQALNSTLDSDQILRELAARLVTTLEAARVTFGHADLNQRGFNVVAQQVGPGRATVEPGRLRGAFDLYPILERALQSGAPFHGILGDPTLPAEEDTYLRAHDLREELVIPVVVRGESVRILEVQWDRPHTLGQEVIALCESIASQAAVALGNAGLYAGAAARAEQDALTGLLNHSALLEYIDRAVALGSPFALFLIDIDNFKLFNDTYGHPVGDAVLTAVAGILRAACREGDMAGRYGGDEMAVVLRNATAREATAVARRLSEAVQGRPHVASSGAVIPISISIGLACYPRQGATRQELIAIADNEMYAAKRRSTRRITTRSRGGAPSYWQDLQLRDAADLLGDSPFGVLEGLVSAVDAKDRYTREHSEHVTQLALLLVDELSLPTELRRVIVVAGLLHDVGKIGVPDRVLRKPGALATEEYAAIKRHVSYGVAIIRGVLNDAEVVDAVAYHHERWDGQGYPHAIAGSETPILGRIMQVADAASAMLLDRPYRQGLPWDQVAARLRQSAGSQFDPALVEPFIAAFGRARARFAS